MSETAKQPSKDETDKDQKAKTKEDQEPETIAPEERPDGLVGYTKTETHQTFRDA